MTTPSAKDLLAQADELIRRTRVPADLPVLTELVSETSASPTAQSARTTRPPNTSASLHDIPNLTDMIEEPAARILGSELEVEEISFDEFKREAINERREPSLGLSAAKTASPAAVAAAGAAAAPMHEIFPSHIKASTTGTARNDGDNTASYTKEQFNAAVAAKLEQMQHSVYSQVMQQLELHATGEMKRNLREALEPPLTQVALDLAAQVAEETSMQMQQIIANAVENEVARLREQILSKRRDGK
jgi:flagellar biosynthesis/type III secretory pathway protein FliH